MLKFKVQGAKFNGVILSRLLFSFSNKILMLLICIYKHVCDRNYMALEQGGLV